jgi:hypothetical protein
MSRTIFRLATATILALAAGCGDEKPAAPPPGVDPSASQAPSAVTASPASQRTSKTVKRGDVQKTGPSMMLE